MLIQTNTLIWSLSFLTTKWAGCKQWVLKHFRMGYPGHSIGYLTDTLEGQTGGDRINQAHTTACLFQCRPLQLPEWLLSL